MINHNSFLGKHTIKATLAKNDDSPHNQHSTPSHFDKGSTNEVSKPWKIQKKHKEKTPSSSQRRHRTKNSMNLHTQPVVLNQTTQPKKRLFKTPPKTPPKICKEVSHRFPKKKKSFKERQKKRFKKQINKIKKLGFKYGKKIHLGIGSYIHKCKIVKIQEKYIYIRYCNDEVEKYSLKNILIMKEQAEYLLDQKKKRDACRLRAKIYYY